MLEILSNIITWLHPHIHTVAVHALLPYIREFFLIIIGFPLIWQISSQIKKVLSKHTSAHVAVLLHNIFFYTALILLTVTILHQMNFQLSALLGAAGILGIAIGFAAQTTVSNVISGIFLLMEGNFSIGDSIEIDTKQGIIESIDLLAIKIRTVENQFIRIPHEMLIKNPVTNFSFFTTRRIELIFEVALTEDTQKIYSLLQTIIHHEKTILQTPEPLIFPYQINQTAIEYHVRAWIKKEDIKTIFPLIANACQKTSKEKSTLITVRYDK